MLEIIVISATLLISFLARRFFAAYDGRKFYGHNAHWERKKFRIY